MFRPSAVRARSTGFSFAEVMFAVIILGVGFIMIAALFPVAIRQSKSTADETTAAAMAKSASSYVDAMVRNGNVSASGEVAAVPEYQQLGAGSMNLSAALWNAGRNNVISPDDPRYAFVAFQSRL